MYDGSGNGSKDFIIEKIAEVSNEPTGKDANVAVKETHVNTRLVFSNPTLHIPDLYH